MRVNKKMVMVLGVLITALLGNSVTANAASDNTYKYSDGDYVNLDDEDSSDSSDNDTDDSDISSSSDSSDDDMDSSESSFKPSVKKIKTISEKTLYKKARKDYQLNKYIKIKVKQIRKTGVSGQYYVKSSKGYVYNWWNDAYNVKKSTYNENKHIKPKKGKTYTVFVPYSTSPRFLREYGCRGSIKGIVWDLAVVHPIVK